MNTTFQGLNRDRYDAKLKVTGQAKYAGDNDLPNLAFGYLIQSSIARGHGIRRGSGSPDFALSLSVAEHPGQPLSGTAR
jgi:CO/xanthine dehydrogenase Mo-binding subunit